jgi:hypothetical protein
MARPERNNVDYFPHPVSHGRKMFFIEKKYGNDGYSSWFKILEQLGSANYHYINLKDQTQRMYLSARCNITEERLNLIIDDLVKLGEFNKVLWEENKILFNQKFIDSIRDAYKKRSNKCITLEDLRIHLLGLGILKGGRNPQRKEKKTKLKDTLKRGIFSSRKNDFVKEIIEIFKIEYQSYFNIELFNAFCEKNISAAGHLLKTFKQQFPKCNSEEMLEKFRIFFREVVRIKNKWYSENMSLSLIYIKLNEIIKIYRNEKTGKTSKTSDRDIAEIVEEQFGNK